MPFNNQIDRTEASPLIPEDAAKTIIQSIVAKSVALSTFRRVTMSRKQMRMPVLATLPFAYFVNGDTGLKQTSEVNWKNKFLNAEEIAVIVPIAEAILDDADFDIWAEVSPRIAEAFGKVIDAAIMFGVNRPTLWGLSVKEAATAAGNIVVAGANGAGDIATDVGDVFTLVENDGFDVNMIAAAKDMKGKFRNLRSTQKEPIFQPSLQADTPPTIYGQPINYDANGTFVGDNTQLIAGDKNQGIIGIRQDITQTRLDQAVITDNSGAIIYNLPQQDMIAMRYVMRLAWEVPNPLTNLNTNEANRYPFAILNRA